MLDYGLIVFRQILIMFFLILIGYFLFKKGHLDIPTTKKLSTLLSTFIGPSCVALSFQREFDWQSARQLGIAFLAAALILGMSMVIANLIYPRSLPDRRNCIVLTNNGFMAIPLLTAMFGPLGVFIGSGHIVVMSIVQWTYSAGQLDRNYRFSAKKILLSPGVLAAAGGLLLFISPVKLPGPVSEAAEFLAAMNTPLAMIILGSYLAQINLKQMFCDRAVWKTALLRMLLIPAATTILLLLLPMDTMTKLVLMVAAAAPTGLSCAMFAQMFDTDYLFATRIVGLTTLLSLILLPGWVSILTILL